MINFTKAKAKYEEGGKKRTNLGLIDESSSYLI